METLYWLALIAFLHCIAVLGYKFVHLVRLGPPKDLSKSSGQVKEGIAYAYTKAMLPGNKESAYYHMPTYTAGIFYHLGTFLSLFLFVWHAFAFRNEWVMPDFLRWAVGIFLFAAAAAGFGLLVKRFAKREMALFSGPDDYISNLLTTLAVFITGLFTLSAAVAPAYFILLALLFLWMPYGKTKHVLYFFFARYHLGYFYGWRGTWPQNQH